jgi:hypothetical protein
MLAVITEYASLTLNDYLLMKKYLLEISKEQYCYVDEAIKWIATGTINYKVVATLPGMLSPAFDKVQLEVEAENDSIFFDLGFFLERARATSQKAHYSLESQTLQVEVSVGFILLCKYFRQDPAGVLSLFAGDVSQQPFNTNGSDERALALEYFERAYAGADLPEDEITLLIEKLQEIKGAWYKYGNQKMKEYKNYYDAALKELYRTIVDRK